MSPEALQPGRYLDSRSDQWSLAVLTFEMLTGHPPFTQEDPLQLGLQIQFEEQRSLATFRQDLPQCVQTAITRALKTSRAAIPKRAGFRGCAFQLGFASAASSGFGTADGKFRHPIPSFVAPEETREPTRLQSDHATLGSISAFPEAESGQALRTVEYSRAELLALLAIRPDPMPQYPQ